MAAKYVTVGSTEVAVPGCYQQLESLPGDPDGSVALGAQTENALCMAVLFEIDESEAMPFDDPRRVIDGIHTHLGDDQGLIETEAGSTPGSRFIYSIVKTLKGADVPEGVQYTLTLDMESGGKAVHLQGFFDETGTTGIRDSIVFQLYASTDGFDVTAEEWSRDPYDPGRRSGVLMNKSERREFDEKFPDHPLSMARAFAACVLDHGATASEEKPRKRESLFGKAGNFFGGAAHAAGDAAADVAGSAAGAVAGFASNAANAAAEAAGGVRDAIGGKVEEAKAAKDEPDEYDRAVIAYNMAYTDLSDAGLALHGQRIRAIDLMGHAERLVNSIANHPKSFDSDLGEVSSHKCDFKEAEAFAREELEAARKSATGAGAGIAAGMAVASMAPSAALWVATTFGTASTGTAISTLSGAAASQAALAWLGGGAVAAGGGGAAAGSALLAMAGPIGWGIAGATLLASIVLFTKKKLDLRDEKQKELTAVKENTEKVYEIAAEINALLARTESLRGGLSDMYGKCMGSYGADFLKLASDDQDSLAAMVNNTLSLSRLLNEQIAQGELETETEADE